MKKSTDHSFKVKTPLGFIVRCTESYWEFIVTKKHPVMKDKQNSVIRALENPDEVRRSRKDSNVYLFYKGKKPRWLCAVTRKDDADGFLITAYPTDAIKIGDVIWKK